MYGILRVTMCVFVLGATCFFNVPILTNAADTESEPCEPWDYIYDYDPFNLYHVGYPDYLRYKDDAPNPDIGIESHYAGNGCNQVWRYLSSDNNVMSYYKQVPSDSCSPPGGPFGWIAINLPSGINFKSISYSPGLMITSGGVGYNYVVICTPLGGTVTAKYISWSTYNIPSQYWGTTITIRTMAHTSNGGNEIYEDNPVDVPP